MDQYIESRIIETVQNERGKGVNKLKKLTRWRRLLHRLDKKWDSGLFIDARDESSNWRTCAIGDKIFLEFGQRVPRKIMDSLAGEYLTLHGRILGYYFAEKIGKCNYDEAEKILDMIEVAPIESLMNVKKYKKEVLA